MVPNYSFYFCFETIYLYFQKYLADFCCCYHFFLTLMKNKIMWYYAEQIARAY